MYDHIPHAFVEAEIAYRRERLQRGFSAHRARQTLFGRLRSARGHRRHGGSPSATISALDQ
jgi:hypothetical protein